METKAVFKTVSPYLEDEMNLPVQNVDESIPFYESIMGFKVASKGDSPHKSVILTRDNIQIGLAENGGDPSQDGCFFEVDDVTAAFNELKANGFEKEDPDYQIDTHGDKTFKLFFVIAPDELCFCLGQRV